jgi:hypothetical protein
MTNLAKALWDYHWTKNAAKNARDKELAVIGKIRKALENAEIVDIGKITLYTYNSTQPYETNAANINRNIALEKESQAMKKPEWVQTEIEAVDIWYNYQEQKNEFLNKTVNELKPCKLIGWNIGRFTANKLIRYERFMDNTKCFWNSEAEEGYTAAYEMNPQITYGLSA